MGQFAGGRPGGTVLHLWQVKAQQEGRLTRRHLHGDKAALPGQPRLRKVLVFCTVSFRHLEDPMSHVEYRYLYRPMRSRAPRWLHRVWAWF